jgi:hypothetical protein
MKLMTQLSLAFQNIQKYLTSPNSIPRFPERTLHTRLFQPNLPDDFILEFFIDQCQFVVCVTSLLYHQQSFASPKMSAKAHRKFTNGQFLRYHSQIVEMTGQVTVFQIYHLDLCSTQDVCPV